MAHAGLLVATAATALLQASRADYVHLVQDGSGVWWFEQGGKRFWSAVANHVNNGGMDDGVGGREKAVCQGLVPGPGSPNNTLCGDSLNFGGRLGYAPYFNVTQDKYGPDESVWAEAQVARLSSWGFNGISGWSARVAEVAAGNAGLYYFHLLDIGVTWPFAWDKGLDYDVFSSNFSVQAEAIAAKEVPPRAQDPHLMAWQTDNEVNWNAVGIPTYVGAYGGGPGGSACVSWLQGVYGTLPALNAAWHVDVTAWTPESVASQLAAPGINATAFARDDGLWQAVVADVYFNVTTAAIRRYDPNHMISGVRFAVNSPAIVAAAGRYCDFIDQHDYSDLPDVSGWLSQIHNITGKPVVLGEFSFTAADSNLPNTRGARAGYPETTQTRRAQKYASYAQALIVQPFIVGYGWWNWCDEPATGRWPDGEDSNYGLVSLADDAYTILTARMADVHAHMAAWHEEGSAPCPTPTANTSTVPLNLYYSATRGDHFATVTGGPGQDCFECYGLYVFVSVIGRVYAQCVPGAVALSQYFADGVEDNALLLSAPKLAGYAYVRPEAYGLPLGGGAQPPGTTTLFSFLRTAPHADFWAVPDSGVANATASGYTNLGAFAYVFDA